VVERRQFLARAGAAAGGLTAGAGALLTRDRRGGAGGDDRPARAAGDRADGDDRDRPEADEEVADPRRGTQEIIWSVATGAPAAALTFDDGPHPDLTPPILDVLDSYGVKATFMAMGYAVEQHRDLIGEVVARGHEVGNHTWSHMHVTKTSAETARREIERGTRILEDVGVPVRLFRPPQGRLSEAVVRLVTQMQQDIVLWSVTRGEKRWRSPDEVAAHVVHEVGPGDIVNLHDGIGRGTFAPDSALADTLMSRRQVEVDALPGIIEQLQNQGLHLGTVSALRSMRDEGLTAT
jgi:peptidoglycan/xylan/chitin deacetylase (PgdA/CDA1 family)